MKTFGARLKFAREQKGLGSRELGRRADTSSNYISKLEMDKCTPTIDFAQRIAMELKVSRLWLLYGDGKMEEETEFYKDFYLKDTRNRFE